MRALIQAVLLLVPITARAADDAPIGVTALVGATLIDGAGSKPLRDAVVLLSGERIRAFGPRGAVVVPAGARAVDLTGKWITPGLVDAHIHLFQSGGLYTRPDVIDLRSVDDRRVDDDFVRLLKERDIVYVTTLGVNEGYREVFEQRFQPTDLEWRLEDPEVLATLDDLADLPWWKGAFWKRWFLHWADPRIAFWNLRRLHEAGVTVAAGSDAGNIGTLHGPALYREMERMAEAGLAPLAILEAATQGGARAMGRASDLGTVEPGKRADLLVLDADPERDIRNTRRIHRVVRGGVILKPEEIMEDSHGNRSDPELHGG